MHTNDFFPEDQTSGFFGNATTMTCSLLNSTSDGHKEYVCIRYNYWFAIITLLFIYLPSVNVIATLYGPGSAGLVGVLEGFVMAIHGGILAVTGYFVPSPGTAIVAWFIICFGAGVFALALLNGNYDNDDDEIDKYHFLLYIPLLAFSPIIFVIIKLLAIIKSNNKFIQSQSTYGSRGEAIFEAAPQLCLQLYIVLLSMSATQKQWLSIITSVATISLPNIENYVLAKGDEYGPKAIIKNICVFLPASLFKVLSVSLLAVFLRGWVILVIVATIILVLVALAIASVALMITGRRHKFHNEEDDDLRQLLECVLLSWLTLAGLWRGKRTVLLRLVSTLTVTITYSLILMIILVICNVDSDYGYVCGAGLSWSELELVKNPLHLNLRLGCTIGLGWISLLVDVLLAWAKFMDPQDKQVGFWDRAVLLEGLGVQFERKTYLEDLDLEADIADLDADLDAYLEDDLEEDLEEDQEEDQE